MTDIGKTWSFGGISIAVEDDSLDYHEHRFSKQSVLDTLYTDLQRFGSGEIFRNIRGVIFSGYSNLLILAYSGYHTLLSDQIPSTEGDYFISAFSASRLVATNYDNPVYRVTVTLRKEL